MEKKISICDYLTDASAYINDLYTLSQEREWPSEPTKEFLTSKFWEAYVDQIVEDGQKVGQDDYIHSYLEDYEEGLCGYPLFFSWTNKSACRTLVIAAQSQKYVFR